MFVDLVRWEALSLWVALVGNVIACVLAVIGLVFGKRPEKTILGLLCGSVLLHTVSIGLRWWRLDHVPVGNGFELLSGNVWGLTLAVLIGYWRLPRLRVFAALALPVVVMLMAWMLLIPAGESTLPPSYDTIWLYVHIGLLKLFLGCALIALGLGGIVLLRSAGLMQERLAGLPDNNRLDDRANRFMAIAFIFDTLGLCAGAIWAQDAWGRYWSWDPLEVWSLVTWLSIGLTLHLRASYRTTPKTNALLILGTFVIAFFTFFGIPFVSTALHKGMV
jgi:cytochrome c-type biogenesis protein CcsB